MGLREGEKLHEELFYETEDVQPTICSKIRKAHGSIQQWGELQRHLSELAAATRIDVELGVRNKIRDIVPEFSGSEKDAMGLDAASRPESSPQVVTV